MPASTIIDAPRSAASTSNDRIPLAQKIAFAAGMNTEYVATGLMTGILWMPFFNIGLGMSPVVLGGILMFLRFWEAVIDPFMGNLSDNTRTRIGRRRPYLFVGAAITALLYPLFWYMPSSLSDIGKIVYLSIAGVAFFTAFTVWSIPYYGMQLELTPNYDERTRLTGWMTFFSKLSYLAGGWLLSSVMLIGMVVSGKTPEHASGWLEQQALTLLQPLIVLFPVGSQSEKPIVVGMQILCPFIALGILLFGLLPALFVQERYYATEASFQKKESFWQSIQESIQCRPLWSLNAAAFFLLMGTSSVATLGQYVNFYYASQGDLALGTWIAGWKGTLVVLVGVSTIPLFIWLGERFDKRTIVLYMLTCCMLGHLTNYFLMTPEHPYWQILSGTFESCSLSAVWIFLPSMKADVADWDELHTSRRREGAINAFHYWFIKMSLTLSMGLGGLLLAWSGFDSRHSVQPEIVTHRMFHIYLILPLLFWGVALLATWRYPITRSQATETRQQLEARRGKL
ncbi:MAG: sodium:melibiose symporter [Verrucomicrobia bacterium Tous-C9LFEB]|nr:MAG: sodium:melibiose symporter [Verrucomicrobia bacterium Tous-C9LFEB]